VDFCFSALGDDWKWESSVFGVLTEIVFFCFKFHFECYAIAVAPYQSPPPDKMQSIFIFVAGGWGGVKRGILFSKFETNLFKVIKLTYMSCKKN
jgi:hypothetical protein